MSETTVFSGVASNHFTTTTPLSDPNGMSGSPPSQPIPKTANTKSAFDTPPPQSSWDIKHKPATGEDIKAGIIARAIINNEEYTFTLVEKIGSEWKPVTQLSSLPDDQLSKTLADVNRLVPNIFNTINETAGKEKISTFESFSLEKGKKADNKEPVFLSIEGSAPSNSSKQYPIDNDISNSLKILYTLMTSSFPNKNANLGISNTAVSTGSDSHDPIDPSKPSPSTKMRSSPSGNVLQNGKGDRQVNPLESLKLSSSNTTSPITPPEESVDDEMILVDENKKDKTIQTLTDGHQFPAIANSAMRAPANYRTLSSRNRPQRRNAAEKTSVTSETKDLLSGIFPENVNTYEDMLKHVNLLKQGKFKKTAPEAEQKGALNELSGSSATSSKKRNGSKKPPLSQIAKVQENTDYFNKKKTLKAALGDKSRYNLEKDEIDGLADLLLLKKGRQKASKKIFFFRIAMPIAY